MNVYLQSKERWKYVQEGLSLRTVQTQAELLGTNSQEERPVNNAVGLCVVEI